MTEPLNPTPPPPPPPPPRAPAPERPIGSFALGYVGGGAAMFLALVVTGALMAVAPALSAIFALLFPAVFVAALVFCIRHGSRTTKGFIAMILTFVGLLVLLIAACFGYFAIHPFNVH